MDKFTALGQMLDVKEGLSYIIWSNVHMIPLRIPCEQFNVKGLKKYGIKGRESIEFISIIKQLCENSKPITEIQWNWLKSVKTELLIKFCSRFDQDSDHKYNIQCIVMEIINNTLNLKYINTELYNLRSVLFNVQIR